jgi:hypothetical protein
MEISYSWSQGHNDVHKGTTGTSDILAHNYNYLYNNLTPMMHYDAHGMMHNDA